MTPEQLRRTEAITAALDALAWFKIPRTVDSVIGVYAEALGEQKAMSLRPNCPECPAWWTYSTEDGGTYSRLIGIDEHDRIVRWRCPDCDHEWERNDEALIWGPTTHPTPPVPTQESRQ